MRTILGVGLGVVVALLVMLGVEALADALFPSDVALDSADRAALAAAMAAVPLGAKLFVVSGWLLSSLAGAWLALRISDWRWAGWFVAVLVLAGGIANLVALPHPVWMQVCALGMPLLGGWLAARLHRKPYPGEALLG